MDCGCAFLFILEGRNEARFVFSKLLEEDLKELREMGLVSVVDLTQAVRDDKTANLREVRAVARGEEPGCFVKIEGGYVRIKKLLSKWGHHVFSQKRCVLIMTDYDTLDSILLTLEKYYSSVKLRQVVPNKIFVAELDDEGCKFILIPKPNLEKVNLGAHEIEQLKKYLSSFINLFRVCIAARSI